MGGFISGKSAHSRPPPPPNGPPFLNLTQRLHRPPDGAPTPTVCQVYEDQAEKAKAEKLKGAQPRTACLLPQRPSTPPPLTLGGGTREVRWGGKWGMAGGFLRRCGTPGVFCVAGLFVIHGIWSGGAGANPDVWTRSAPPHTSSVVPPFPLSEQPGRVRLAPANPSSRRRRRSVCLSVPAARCHSSAHVHRFPFQTNVHLLPFHFQTTVRPLSLCRTSSSTTMSRSLTGPKRRAAPPPPLPPQALVRVPPPAPPSKHLWRHPA